MLNTLEEIKKEIQDYRNNPPEPQSEDMNLRLDNLINLKKSLFSYQPKTPLEEYVIKDIVDGLAVVHLYRDLEKWDDINKIPILNPSHQGRLQSIL